MTASLLSSLTIVGAGFKAAGPATDTRKKAAEAIESQKGMIGQVSVGRKGSRSWVQLKGDTARFQIRYGSRPYLPSTDKTKFWECPKAQVAAIFDELKAQVLAGEHDEAIAKARKGMGKKPTEVTPAPQPAPAASPPAGEGEQPQGDQQPKQDEPKDEGKPEGDAPKQDELSLQAPQTPAKGGGRKAS